MTFREKIYDTIEPKNSEHLLAKCYDWSMLGAIVCGITPLMFKQQTVFFLVLDILSCFLFIIDYLLRWITADIWLKKGKKSFVLYPFTPMAIIDMLSILPTLRLLNPTFKVARISRLLRLLRVVKIIRYFEPFNIIRKVIYRQRRILLTVLAIAVFYVFITALIMFNAENEINPETGEFLFDNFFEAFYWSACTLTTVGYGDICPVSEIGRVISIISSMVGVAVIALPSGVLTAGYLDELRNRKNIDPVSCSSEEDCKENGG